MVAWTMPCFAVTSVSWDTTGYAEFAKGKLHGLALTADGLLRLGAQVTLSAELNQPALWSIAVAPDGSVFAGTGHSGKLLHISKAGAVEVVWSAPQPEIFAVAVDRKGTVWAASSPTGGLYRIANGKAEEVWHSTEKYIWALQPAPDGSVFVGAGEAGRVIRITPSGSAEVYYDTGQVNVTALALGNQGQLYAGTDPNGLLYAIRAKGQAEILYDSSLPEIRAIVPDPAGALYVGALGGALATRTVNAAGAGTAIANTVVTAAMPTVITVTENAQSGSAVTAGPPKVQTPVVVPSVAAGTTVTETAGVEKSAIYRISSDRTVETLFASKEENVYDVALAHGGGLLFATDNHGRVYQWEAGRLSLVAELGAGEAVRLGSYETNRFAALSSPARLTGLGLEQVRAGQEAPWYESAVHDAGNVARWGHIRSRPEKTELHFWTRTGNSTHPDATWTPWMAAGADGAIRSPIARYVQWKAEWHADNSAFAQAVSVSLLPQNAAPIVRSIAAASVAGTSATKNAANAANSAAAYSITVTDTGESAPASVTGAASQAVSRLQATQTQITWQADDPDSDKLVYSLYFKAEDANEWQLVRSRMFENSILLDPDVLADGRYLFRVVASDSPSNAKAFAKQSEMVSAPTLVDNTPPLVTIDSQQRSSSSAEVIVDASDKTSPLRRAEFSVDAGYWQPIEAEDGITDTETERFRIQLDHLRSGEHMVVIRVFDSAGNAGLAKTLLR